MAEVGVKYNETSTAPPEQTASLTVALRIRPMSDDEILQGATPTAHKVDESMVILMDPADDPDDILRANRSREKQYMFDVSFDGSSNQKEVYEQTCKALIPSVINGYHATLFAYGATGAGKTYTMLGTDNNPGIMALALNDLFREMSETLDEMNYRVSMSYLEIYNEMIRDLLSPDSGYLDLREDSKGVQVAGLSEVIARSSEEVMDILLQGNKQRTSEPTAANKTSSRSHAILQITVRQRHRLRTGAKQEVRVGKLFLIDLAGSERAANTMNRGKRMVEGAHINRSLLALGNCINALSERNGSKYVNYRDSKLTRLLKDALGGNCKTVMIAHISPASVHFEESRNTLVYADRAKNIKTKVRRNVMDVSYHITQYNNIISDLREEIQQLRARLDSKERNSPGTVRRTGSGQLNKVKAALTSIFKDQMDLKRSMMELNNTAMEISLETTRNQLLIKKWERECAGGMHRHLSDSDEPMTEKQRELAGHGTDDIPPPEEVRQAQDELLSLAVEKERTERLKANVAKELENAKEKAAKIEETIPIKMGTDEQEEILRLLCKLHECEIENVEMQAACLLKNFELRRKDMQLVEMEQHRSLCDEIIHQQRSLIEANKIIVPKELDDLYELYQHDREMMMERINISLPDINHNIKTVSVSNMGALPPVTSPRSDDASLPFVFVPSSKSRKNMLRKASTNLSKFEDFTIDDDDDEPGVLFSQSPKSKRIKDEQARQVRSSHDARRTGTNKLVKKTMQRHGSIITLSSNNSVSTPPPVTGRNIYKVRSSVDTPRSTKDEEKKVITSNTRSIAALAAKRKTRVRADSYSLNDPNLNKTYTSLQNIPLAIENSKSRTDADNYLTQSRLEQHDKRYSDSSVTLNRMLDDDDVDSFSQIENSSNAATDPTATKQIFLTARPVYRNPKALKPGNRKKPNNTVKSNKQNTHLNDGAGAKKALKPKAKSENYAAYQQLSRTTPRQTRQVGDYKRSKIPASQQRPMQPIPQAVLGADLQTLEPVPTPPTKVHQSNTEYGKGHTVQRKIRGPGGASTDNMSLPSDRSSKKGTGATSRDREMHITGFGIH